MAKLKKWPPIIFQYSNREKNSELHRLCPISFKWKLRGRFKIFGCPLCGFNDFFAKVYFFRKTKNIMLSDSAWNVLSNGAKNFQKYLFFIEKIHFLWFCQPDQFWFFKYIILLYQKAQLDFSGLMQNWIAFLYM